MPHTTRSSSTSAPCLPAEALPIETFEGRLEWRPSRLLVAALLLLGMAAAFAVLASEMPRIAAWPLALAALACGAWRAWRETRQPARHIVLMPVDMASTVDGKPVAAMTVRWRGPIACLQWRDGDGHVQRRIFWPDTLPARRRRELRLAAPAPMPARAPASMAP